MKIHTNGATTPAEMKRALRETGLENRGVYIAVCEEKVSRSHLHAYEVRLSAWERPEIKRRRNMDNSGLSAMYAEHGLWMSVLFANDPTMKLGSYKGVADFHYKTRYAFFELDEVTLPSSAYARRSYA